MRRVYLTARRRTACRKYNGVRFTYEGNAGVRTIAEGLNAGTTRLLTAAEASAFGKGIGRCFNCMSIGRPGHLTDDRSLAVGYGETCATNNGWWYPNEAEAGKILHGSFDLDAKLTQALAPTTSAAPFAPTTAEKYPVAPALVPVEDDELSEALDDEQDIAEDWTAAHCRAGTEAPRCTAPQAVRQLRMHRAGSLTTTSRAGTLLTSDECIEDDPRLP